ncbi:hypothetical protein CEP53_007128 [Fusarium sp. AF-6]|nr:hypothetical protein CEP53_007128 [Fusarium sp. AF-6]
MSGYGKRKLASLNKMQERVDGLVGSGAIVLGDGKRLKIGDDGLLQVIDPALDSSLPPDSGARKRLINAINYLESSAGPKSVGWCEALVKLRQLLENNVERGDQLDIRAWEICEAANNEAIDDIAYMDMFHRLLRHGGMESEWMYNNYDFTQFPQRACRLLGIASPDDFTEEAWDNGLANQMLEKDLGAYRLIHRGFHHMVESAAQGHAWSDSPEDKKASKHVSLFLKLEPVKAIRPVMETKEFLILERKAKTAQRIEAKAISVPRNRAAQKQEADSD